MKFLLTALLLICYSPILFSQSIQINSPEGQQSFNSNTFSTGDTKFTVSDNRFILGSETISNPLAWSFSYSNRKASFLMRNSSVRLASYSADGKKLIENKLEFFDTSDNTLGIYQFDSGKIILRDNVANFTFLDVRGETAYSISNSSGSTQGERESQLAANSSGNTVVLYNPVISYGDKTGSRAQIVYGDRSSEIFFSNRDEEIRDVRVTNSGAFITIVTKGSGGSKVYMFDRFGNEIFQIRSDEDLIGATLDQSASHLTIFSSGRVQVYAIPSGTRLGSASSRSSIIYAGYDSDNQMIIALGGNLNEMEIETPEISAVSISKREIAREEVPFSVSTLDADRIDLSKKDSQYVISGLNRQLLIDVSF